MSAGAPMHVGGSVMLRHVAEAAVQLQLAAGINPCAQSKLGLTSW